MNALRKAALILEAIIGFGLPLYFWCLGLLMIPFLALGFLSGGEIGKGVSVLAIALGGIGIWGTFQLFLKVFFPSAQVARPRMLLGCVVFGLLGLPVAVMAAGMGPKGFSAIVLPPLVVTLHFLYLARGYLWQAR